ncbi:MAG: hypothetical protein IT367_00640 [Candidatus Hydrogenedentes bacterium]|nr:hypothetical protein [Candidatus Hydrogenedentota bacterium]
MYRHLRHEGIARTAEQLRLRVSERFPNSGLSKVAAELADIAHAAEVRAAEIVEPIVWLRNTVYTGIILLLAVCIFIVVQYRPGVGNYDLSHFVQILDGAMNVAVLSGGAIFSLVTIENRVRRSRALKAAHELRALAHVIDMHQLTKDPDRVMGATSPTEHSPDVKLTPAGLTRYLNYCTEMLSLIGKTGAYYIQDFNDPVAIEAINDLEALTTGLSQKMWQKIMIVHQSHDKTPATKKRATRARK